VLLVSFVGSQENVFVQKVLKHSSKTPSGRVHFLATWLGRVERQKASAQEWTNRTVIGHELLICSKMCFTKTELVQLQEPMVQYFSHFHIEIQLGSRLDSNMC